MRCRDFPARIVPAEVVASLTLADRFRPAAVEAEMNFKDRRVQPFGSDFFVLGLEDWLFRMF
jgi:hypothetical protein